MLRVSLAALIASAGTLFINLHMATADSPNGATANSNKPGWLPVIVARGELKQQIESTPIVDRPNRPLHFYGNAVRRKYYRANRLPQTGEGAKNVAAPPTQVEPAAQ
jgi:hypothetical protein